MKFCLNCKKEILKNKFCSKSCSASYNNIKRGRCLNKNGTKKSICIKCGVNEVEVNIRHASKFIKCIKCKKIKCSYCNDKLAIIQLNNGKYCCEMTYHLCYAIIKKNSDGLKRAHDRGIKFHTFTEDDIKNYNSERIKKSKKDAFGINILKTPSKYKEYLYELQGKRCEICKITSWLDKDLNFEVDHIDGNNRNNQLENLRILCPNCHSQTTTYCGRNKNNRKSRYTDDIIYQTYQQQGNIHKTLLYLGYSAKSANYQTVKRIILEKEFKFKIKSPCDEIGSTCEV